MKTISLQKAVELLDSAAGVIIESANHLIIYPSVDLQNDPDNPFFHVSWEDEGDFRIECFERDNQNPKFDGSNLYFIDEDGEELKVTLLEVMKNNEYE